MSLYSDYLKEAQFLEIIEDDSGFITYSLNGSVCSILDWYVKPESRGLSSYKYVNEVIDKAKEAGCSLLQTSLNMRIPEPRRSKNLRGYLTYGFRLLNSTPEMLWLIKEI